MEIVNFQGFGHIGASGICPHCSNRSYFRPVGGPHTESHTFRAGRRITNAAQCESCKNFILVVGDCQTGGNDPYHLVAVYPLDKPDDRVNEAVPIGIATDFAEALRCQWVKAYRATVAMCRRAIQASALEKGASAKRKLIEQIDELANKGIITQPLREMAHEVRLTGNVGAHPDEDCLKDVVEKDANDIVEFTREFFHHVYVMPAMLQARRQKSTATE